MHIRTLAARYSAVQRALPAGLARVRPFSATLATKRPDPRPLQSNEELLQRKLTRVAQKPSIKVEQATSSYSFRSSELSQPI